MGSITGADAHIVFDYLDSTVPMLARMALKRQAAYRSLGYSLDAR